MVAPGWRETHLQRASALKALRGGMKMGSSTASAHVMAKKRSIVHPRNEGSRHRRALGVCKRDNAQGHGHHLGPCPGPETREQEAARSNRSASLVSVAVTSQWYAQKRLLTQLRVHHGLLVANMVEGHHEGVLHAACSR